MTRAALLACLRAHRYAVEASTGPAAGIQAAVVGIAVLDTFEVVFDAIAGSRYLEIEGGMVPLPDQMPEEFARHVLEFLRSQPTE